LLQWKKFSPWGTPGIRIEGVDVWHLPVYITIMMMKFPVCSSIYSFIWVSWRDYWCSKSPASFSSFCLRVSLYNLNRIRSTQIHAERTIAVLNFPRLMTSCNNPPLSTHPPSSTMINRSNPCLATESFPTFLTLPEYMNFGRCQIGYPSHQTTSTLPYFFVLSGFSPRPGVALCGRCLESEIGPLNAPIPIVTKGGF